VLLRPGPGRHGPPVTGTRTRTRTGTGTGSTWSPLVPGPAPAGAWLSTQLTARHEHAAAPGHRVRPAGPFGPTLSAPGPTMAGMNPGGPETRLIDGRFELLDRLGGGGMGLVWRARDTALDREVALKEVRPPDAALVGEGSEGARQLRERVLREARSLARLQHPNVVIIHHIVDTPDLAYPWLVMELVQGGSLAGRLERGPLTVPEAARIGRGVLSALGAAHTAGIQHRDVKPGNVLLRTNGTPVLTDFGIAAMLGSTALTATGALIGSPEYMAPERIRGVEGHPSSDLWSLGMVLYVAVEGHHPLRRATALATLAAVLDEPLPPPVRAGELGPLLAALLARDPAVRPDPGRIDQVLAAAERGLGPGPGTDGATGPGYLSGTGGWVAPQPPGGAGGTNGTGDPTSWALRPPAPGGTGPAASPYDTPNPHTPNPHTPNPHTPHPHTPHPGSSYPPGAYAPGGVPADRPPTAAPPGGAPTPPPGWAPRGPQAPVPAPGHRAPAPAPRRRGRTTVAVLSAATVSAIGVVVWSLLPDGGKGDNASGQPGTSPSVTRTNGSAPTAQVPTTGDGTTPTTAPPVQGTLLTPAGVRSVVSALRPSFGGGKFIEMTVYPEYANADAPTPADATLYDNLSYRDGQVTRRPGSTVDTDQVMLSPDVFNWDVIPGLLTKAQQTLKVPHPTSRYLIIEADTFRDNTPSIKVYLSDDYGGGYLAADAKGKILDTYPRGG
jgi:serine/threonine protein kinase